MYLLKSLIERWEQRAQSCAGRVPDGLSECIIDAKMEMAKAVELNWKPKDLYSIIHFKKHKGKTLKEVIEQDPGYVNWLRDNVEGFEIDETAHNYLIENGG